MKPKILTAGLLLCASLVVGCAGAPQVQRHGGYVWIAGVPGMYANEADLQAARQEYSGGGLGGPPVVWQWSPEGMAVSAAIANGIRAAKCGR
jgi:hypothetical protein